MLISRHSPLATDALLDVGLCANLFDAIAEASGPQQALVRIDHYRRLLAGPGIFSIQLNVTTREDPVNEIRLQRLYSSAGHAFPVEARKRKTLTPWTETLFVRGEVFVAEGSDALENTFDDYAQMRPLGLNAAVNIPLLRGSQCYATFNVFGTCGGWQPAQLLALRLLALLAARWVTPAPDLFYSLTPGQADAPTRNPL